MLLNLNLAISSFSLQRQWKVSGRPALCGPQKLIIHEDGADPQEPLRRLPYSVPQLVEHSPFSFDDPNRVFVGKKETSIIEVDLDDGIVKSVMGGTNSWHNDGEEEADDDYRRRRNRRIVQIGRTGEPVSCFIYRSLTQAGTDYTIKVISHSTLLQTLSFSTYGPNNMNKPLQRLWKRTPDDIYLQPSWDHNTYAFETLGESALWYKHFKYPVVAVFDVVLQDTGTGSNPKPLVLLQPRPKLQELFPTRAARLEGIDDKTFINRIGDSLFAMGHINYPLVNLAPPTRLIESNANGEGCVGIECFTGVRYTEREGANSRISRLIEAGPANKSAEDRLIRRAAEEGAEDKTAPTMSEIAAIPLPSRSDTLGPDGNFIGLHSQRDNHRPKLTRAPLWTLALPFVGGFIAIWLILRKFMKPASNRRDRLIQPLQNAGSPTDVTTALLSPRAHSRHSSGSAGAYATYAGATTYTAVDSDAPRATQRESSNSFNEKMDIVPLQNDEDANLSLALEDARVGSGFGMSVEVKEPEESDGEDEEPQDGKKKTRRGGRGKKKKKKPTPLASSSQNGTDPLASSEASAGQDSGSASADYVMIDKQPQALVAPAKMELPLPVTSSSSSLVVTSKVLGMYSFFFPDVYSNMLLQVTAPTGPLFSKELCKDEL